MKAGIKTIIALTCAALMISSAASTVYAAEAGTYDLAEIYVMAQRALDQQAIQNVMSKHVMYHCYGEHQKEREELWVNEPENRSTASFGQNQGYWVGYDNVWDAYVAYHTESWLASAKSYCEAKGINLEGWTDEEILDVYGGVGQLLMHCTTTGIIEIAADGQTARCFWYSPGMVKETGQSANAIWEAYGVDMVKEGNEWKIWHLHMYTDFTGSFFVDLGGNTGNTAAGESNGETAETAEAANGESVGESSNGESSGESSGGSSSGEGGEVLAMGSDTYISNPSYTTFSTDRLRSEMELLLPSAYDSWNFKDPAYGPTEEEYINFGVDLDAWYAAH